MIFRIDKFLARKEHSLNATAYDIKYFKESKHLILLQF